MSDDHDELRSERDAALEEVESLRIQLQAAERGSGEFRGERDAAREEADSLRVQLERAQTLSKNQSRIIDTLARERDAALGQVESLERDFKLAMDTVRRADIARRKLTVDLAEARALADKRLTDYAEAVGALENARSLLAAGSQAIAKLEAEAAEAENLRRLYRNLTTHVSSLQRQLATAQAICDEYRIALASRDETIDDLRRQHTATPN